MLPIIFIIDMDGVGRTSMGGSTRQTVWRMRQLFDMR